MHGINRRGSVIDIKFAKLNNNIDKGPALQNAQEPRRSNCILSMQVCVVMYVRCCHHRPLN